MPEATPTPLGSRVQVHQPAWQDATGRCYPAHARHGKTGVVTALTDATVGAQRLVVVRYDQDGVEFPHWTDELRLQAGKENLCPKARP